MCDVSRNKPFADCYHIDQYYDDCRQCYDGCEACLGIGHECTKCHTAMEYFWDGYDTYCKCPEGLDYYYNETLNACYQCHSRCNLCFGPEYNQC